MRKTDENWKAKNEEGNGNDDEEIETNNFYFRRILYIYENGCNITFCIFSTLCRYCCLDLLLILTNIFSPILIACLNVTLFVFSTLCRSCLSYGLNLLINIFFNILVVLVKIHQDIFKTATSS